MGESLELARIMTTRTRPFSGFEWLVAGRYLRSKRQESFISVISGFSLVGIALGVATLIIVMSVMNGFRSQLLGRILGLNGHAIVQTFGGVQDYDAVDGARARRPGRDGGPSHRRRPGAGEHRRRVAGARWCAASRARI